MKEKGSFGVKDMGGKAMKGLQKGLQKTGEGMKKGALMTGEGIQSAGRKVARSTAQVAHSTSPSFGATSETKQQQPQEPQQQQETTIEATEKTIEATETTIEATETETSPVAVASESEPVTERALVVRAAIAAPPSTDALAAPASTDAAPASTDVAPASTDAAPAPAAAEDADAPAAADAPAGTRDAPPGVADSEPGPSPTAAEFAAVAAEFAAAAAPVEESADAVPPVEQVAPPPKKVSLENAMKGITKGFQLGIHKTGEGIQTAGNIVIQGGQGVVGVVAGTVAVCHNQITKTKSTTENDSQEQATDEQPTEAEPLLRIAPTLDTANLKRDSTQQQHLPVQPKPFVDLPPDETVTKKMDVIISKTLHGATIPQFANVVWEDAEFYKAWLASSGKFDITVEPWNAAGPFVGSWDQESYTHYRTGHFQFKRTTHLYTGPPIASVKHEQWMRFDDNRCILHMQLSMTGIPFSDCFCIQIRWVTTRLADAAISVQVGLKVHFLKATLLAGKIESGTREETTKAELSLLDAVTQALAKEAAKHPQTAAAKRRARPPLLARQKGMIGSSKWGKLIMLQDDDDELTPYYHDDEEEQNVLPPCFFWNGFWAHCLNKKADNSNPMVRKALAAQAKLQSMLDAYHTVAKQNPNFTPTTESRHLMESELTDIHASLDKMMKYIQQHSSNKKA